FLEPALDQPVLRTQRAGLARLIERAACTLSCPRLRHRPYPRGSHPDLSPSCKLRATGPSGTDQAALPPRSPVPSLKTVAAFAQDLGTGRAGARGLVPCRAIREARHVEFDRGASSRLAIDADMA